VRSRCPQNQYMCAGHPNIVELQDVFMTDKHLAIVMEYAGETRPHIDDLLLCQPVA
jgi:serine/threonine protein kinase